MDLTCQSKWLSKGWSLLRAEYGELSISINDASIWLDLLFYIGYSSPLFARMVVISAGSKDNKDRIHLVNSTLLQGT